MYGGQKNSTWSRPLSRILSGSQIYVYGTNYNTPDGTCIRDYIHPEDIISAHMIALDSDISGVYNLGSGQDSPCGILLRTLFPLLGGIGCCTNHGEQETEVLIANSDKFRNLTGWEPKYTLKEMVATAWKAYGK